MKKITHLLFSYMLIINTSYSQDALKSKSSDLTKIGLEAHVFTKKPLALMHFDGNGTRWDTTGIEIYHAYNGNLEPTDLTYKFYKGAGEYENYFRWTEFYNISGQKDSAILYVWDSTLFSWITDEKFTYHYTPSGKLLEERYFIDGTKIFLPAGEVLYYKKHNYYDLNDSLLADVRYQLDAPSFTNLIAADSNAYTRNVQGNVETQTSINLLIQQKERYIFQYDGNNNRISRRYEKYDENSSQWRNYQRISYTFNPSNKETSNLWESWDGSNWQNMSKQETAYNVNENPILSTGYDWNLLNNNWDIESIQKMKYIPTGEIASFSYIYTEDNGQTWEKDDSLVFYYDYIPEGIFSRDKNYPEISVFPNPTTGRFTIQNIVGDQTKSFEVYTIHGDLIIKKEISKMDKRIELDISNYPNGIYFLKVNSSESIFQNKLIKN